MRLFATLLLFLAAFSAYSQEITQYESNVSLPYQVVINTYKKVANGNAQARLLEMGPTDSGNPLHLLVLSGDGDFDPASIKAKGKGVSTLAFSSLAV